MTYTTAFFSSALSSLEKPLLLISPSLVLQLRKLTS